MYSKDCERLAKVTLCEGLSTIGKGAFYGCRWMEEIVIPATVKTIGDWSFAHPPLESLHLPDSIESIGENAFCNVRLPVVRIPPLVSTISKCMFYNCKGFSIELPDSITQIDENALESCASLRNVALPPSEVVGVDTFEGCKDLIRLFCTERRVINALKHRFDNLPIHKMIYYQSYNNLTSDQLDGATIIRSGHRRTLRISKLDPTGKEQDCLGMTPLHILACSTVQRLDLYKILVEKYPENLIAKDRWGAVPLFYAVWRDSPNEIVQVLVEKYQSLYPNYVFDWNKMVTTICLANAPDYSFRGLLKVRKKSFPDQEWGDWDKILEKALAASDENDDTRILRRPFAWLVWCSIGRRTKKIGIKMMRDELLDMLQFRNVPDGIEQRRDYISEVQTLLDRLEEEYSKLKEATSMIELMMWKIKLNDCFSERKYETRRFKKMKFDETDVRNKCRVTCGAGTVIEHVLPYLLPKTKTSDE